VKSILLLVILNITPACAQSDLDALVKSYAKVRGFMGSVLVARDGRILLEKGYGFANLEWDIPNTPDAKLRLGSLTKQFTAATILQLQEAGKLRVDDLACHYLQDCPDAWKAVTIHHLLTHTSGLPSARPTEIENITITRDRTLAEVVALLAKQEPEFAPGTQFRYTSGGFAILGRIIEVVSGKPYEQFVKERIFDPLGMRDSSFFIPAEKRARVATVYRRQNGKLERWQEIDEYTKRAKYSAPEFGMYSTAQDLAALGQMMLDGGTFKGRRILSGLSVAVMTSNHTLNIKSVVTQRPAHHGLGLGLSGDPMDDFPLTSPGSYGHNGAFGAMIWIDPKERLIRIFLEHVFAPGNEVDIFMAMAGAAVVE